MKPFACEWSWRLGEVALAVCLAFLAGCAYFRPTPQEIALRTEPMLAAAGFRMIPADTPEKLAHLKSMTPLTLVYSLKKEKPRYWYADPYSCNCLYVGNETAYQKYQNLRIQSQIAENQQQAAMINEEAAQEQQLDFLLDPYGPFLW
jgi:hypothetical protein